MRLHQILHLHQQDDSELSIVMNNSFLEVLCVIITSPGETASQLYKEKMTMEKWHNVLVQFR